MQFTPHKAEGRSVEMKRKNLRLRYEKKHNRFIGNRHAHPGRLQEERGCHSWRPEDDHPHAAGAFRGCGPDLRS